MWGDDKRAAVAFHLSVRRMCCVRFLPTSSTPAKGHEITHSHAEPRISGSCAYTASPLDTCLQQVLVEAAADKSLARGHSGRRGARGLSVRADLL